MEFPTLFTARLRLVIARPGLEEPLARFFAENFAGHLKPWSPTPPPGGLGADHWARQLPGFEKEFAAGTSARLLERLGFVKEGYAREYLHIDGAWRDHVLTARTNPGFDAAWLRE